MKKTTIIMTMLAAVAFGAPNAARAQGTPQPDSNLFVSVSAGGQFQTRTFSTTSVFTLFGEQGSVNANQTVGRGFVFDASGGYRVWHDLFVAVGVSTFNGKGSAAAVASVPNPLFFGKPTVSTFPASAFGDLKQTDVAANFQLVWMTAVTDKFDVSVFVGPSVIRVKQDVASVTGTQNAAAQVVSESKTTGKAGTGGVDLSYRLNTRYAVGGFVRYLGGEVNLPSAPKMKIGGLQVAGGIRIHY